MQNMFLEYDLQFIPNEINELQSDINKIESYMDIFTKDNSLTTCIKDEVYIQTEQKLKKDFDKSVQKAITYKNILNTERLKTKKKKTQKTKQIKSAPTSLNNSANSSSSSSSSSSSITPTTPTANNMKSGLMTKRPKMQNKSVKFSNTNNNTNIPNGRNYNNNINNFSSYNKNYNQVSSNRNNNNILNRNNNNQSFKVNRNGTYSNNNRILTPYKPFIQQPNSRYNNFFEDTSDQINFHNYQQPNQYYQQQQLPQPNQQNFNQSANFRPPSHHQSRR